MLQNDLVKVDQHGLTTVEVGCKGGDRVRNLRATYLIRRTSARYVILYSNRGYRNLRLQYTHARVCGSFDGFAREIIVQTSLERRVFVLREQLNVCNIDYRNPITVPGFYRALTL